MRFCLLVSTFFIFCSSLFGQLSDPTLIESGGNTTNAATIVTGSFSPPANRLLLVSWHVVANTDQTHNSVAQGFSIVGSWTKITDATQASNRVSIWWAVTTSNPGSGTMTLTLAGNVSRRTWAVVDYENADLVNPISEFTSGSGTATR